MIQLENTHKRARERKHTHSHTHTHTHSNTHIHKFTHTRASSSARDNFAIAEWSWDVGQILRKSHIHFKFSLLLKGSHVDWQVHGMCDALTASARRSTTSVHWQDRHAPFQLGVCHARTQTWQTNSKHAPGPCELQGVKRRRC